MITLESLNTEFIDLCALVNKLISLQEKISEDRLKRDIGQLKDISLLRQRIVDLEKQVNEIEKNQPL